MTRHLVTSALPYANGSIHLGHLVEYAMTDFYVRHRRAKGEDIIYVCADDTHGSGIELNAKKHGITPEQLIARSYDEHRADFAAFHIEFDVYGSTNSPTNKVMAERVYGTLKDNGHIVRKSSKQMYSESMGRFLPDRWVKGTCPSCGTANQYGDGCESCNAQYESTELIDAVDAIEGLTPVVRETEHLYFQVSNFDAYLREWVPKAVSQTSVQNFLTGWLDDLHDWCISRDAPYFGFEIPGEPGKFFYVWLDAPVGYIAATQEYCEANGRDWTEYWARDADSTITHVIGKDIVRFHTLFWPAMLKSANLREPDRVQVHGFLKINGEKMSKSRGTFVNARTYLDHLDPDYLRFYIAMKLSPAVDDIDLNLEDFTQRVNAELVNKAVNLSSRVSKFVSKFYDGKLPTDFVPSAPEDVAVIRAVEECATEVDESFRAFDFARGIRALGVLSDVANTYYQESQPWAVRKDDEARAAEICGVGLYVAVAVLQLLQPVTPTLVARFFASLSEPVPTDVASKFWLPKSLTAIDSLMDRIDPKAVQAMLEQSKAEGAPPLFDAADVVEVESFGDEITFEDFSKVDIRVGVIGAAQVVEKADKLLQLTVHCGREINVFAGVRKAYPDPSILVGRRVLVVANLKPRKMRFGVSEGMLLAMSGDNDEGLQLVHPDGSAKGGWTAR